MKTKSSKGKKAKTVKAVAKRKAPAKSAKAKRGGRVIADSYMRG